MCTNRTLLSGYALSYKVKKKRIISHLMSTDCNDINFSSIFSLFSLFSHKNFFIISQTKLKWKTKKFSYFFVSFRGKRQWGKTQTFYFLPLDLGEGEQQRECFMLIMYSFLFGCLLNLFFSAEYKNTEENKEEEKNLVSITWDWNSLNCGFRSFVSSHAGSEREKESERRKRRNETLRSVTKPINSIWEQPKSQLITFI